MHKRIAGVIAAAVAAAGLLFVVGAVPAGAGASAGPPGNARSAGTARHSPARPFGMSALTYQRMMEQVPLDNAAGKIRRAAAGSAAGPDGLVQIKVEQDRHSLVVYWHGQVPAAVRRVLTEVRARIGVTVSPARYSRAELDHQARLVIAGARHTGANMVGPRADGSGLEVGVAGKVPALTRATASAHFGVTVPVTVVSHARAQPAFCHPEPVRDALSSPARCNDYAQFWGGADLELFKLFNTQVPEGSCSTGFGVYFPSGAYGIVTAGHCVKYRGVTYTDWLNGQWSAELGNSFVSPWDDSSWNPTDDAAVIYTPAGSGDQIYNGPSMIAGDTHDTLTVSGQDASNKWDWICEEGAFGGVLCNSQVKNTNWYLQYPDGSWVSGLIQASGGDASHPHSGDSGGPVLSLPGDGTITAKGIVNTSAGGDGNWYYTPIDEISNDVGGLTVNTP